MSTTLKIPYATTEFVPKAKQLFQLSEQQVIR